MQIVALRTFYLISKSNIGRITSCIPVAVVKLTIYGLIKKIKILEPFFKFLYNFLNYLLF